MRGDRATPDATPGSRPCYHLVAGAQEVQLWAAERLPFEPRGWLVQMREDLREALRGLGGSMSLRATYTSRFAPPHSDVENTLIYNVGTRCFANLCLRGLLIDRELGEPPECPAGLGGPARHHYCYRSVGASPELAPDALGKRLARWSGLPMPPLHTDTKPSVVWYALKRHSGLITDVGQCDSTFAVKLALEAPGVANLTSLLKPLSDGIIGAFHRHEGEEPRTARCAAVVAGQVGESPAVVQRMLCEDGGLAVLGSRQLVWPRGAGVQWNPRDDDCAAIHITLATPPDGQWRLSGSLYATANGPAPRLGASSESQGQRPARGGLAAPG